LNPARGKVQATAEGVKVLGERPAKIDRRFLEQYPSFLEFKTRRGQTENVTADRLPPGVTPEEAIETAYRDLRSALAEDILERVLSCTPQFFERLVVELLVKWATEDHSTTLPRPLAEWATMGSMA
jgi:restriction system protein